MKKCIFLLILSFVLFGCSENKTNEKKRLTVAVTVQPYSRILHEIGGDSVNIIALIPLSASPHTFEPKTNTLIDFSKADVYFSDGAGMDKAWLPRFLGVNKNVSVFKISDGISFRKFGKNTKVESDLDPHIWTSPKELRIIGKNMERALIQKDSANQTYYQKNLEKFNQRLDVLDSLMKATVANLPINRRSFIVFHPAYGYLARDYGLTQLAIEVNGKEAKPKDMKNLVEKARENNVHAILVQPQFSKRSAEALAKELSAVILKTNPLSYDVEENIRNFAKMLSESTQK